MSSTDDAQWAKKNSISGKFCILFLVRDVWNFIKNVEINERRLELLKNLPLFGIDYAHSEMIRNLFWSTYNYYTVISYCSEVPKYTYTRHEHYQIVYSSSMSVHTVEC